MKHPKPWAAYARISVATDESVSIDGQRAIIERWAKAYGHQLVWFVDENVSGSKDIQRPQRDELERRLAAGEFAGVVVKAVDRLARNLRDFVRLADTAGAQGGSVVVVEGGIDTGTDAGRMMMSLLAVFAEFEATQISNRLKVSNEIRRQQGRAIGMAPYGFMHRYDEDGAWRIINPEQAKGVRQIVKWIVDGAALNEAARRANAAGIMPPKSKQWTAETLAQMVRNPALNGQMPRGEDVERTTDGRPKRYKHLQIIDNATWAQLGKALDQRSKHRFSPAKHEPLLLAPVVKCGSCGGPTCRSGAGNGYSVYRCTNGGHLKCPKPITIGVQKLESYVDDCVSVLEHMELMHFVRSEDPQLRAELDEITENVERLVAALSTASAGDVAKYAQQLTSLKELQAVLLQRIEEEPVEQMESVGYSPGIDWREADEAKRRMLVPMIFDSIVVMPATHNATPVEDRVTITYTSSGI